MSVGSKLNQLFGGLDRYPAEVARASGVPVSTIYGLMSRNSYKVTLNQLYLIAKEMGVDLEYFVDDEVKQKVRGKMTVREPYF